MEKSQKAAKEVASKAEPEFVVAQTGSRAFRTFNYELYAVRGSLSHAMHIIITILRDIFVK